MRILNKVDLILDIIKDESLSDKSLTFILDSKVADVLTDELLDFVPLCEDDTEADVIKVLDNNSFVTISINRYIDREEMFIDPLIYKDGRQYYNDSDLYFVQDELLDVVEFDKLTEGKIYIISEDDKINGVIENIEDEDDAYLEDCVCDYLNGLLKLTEEDCLHCYTKDFFEEIYETAYYQAVLDIEG